jgi:hypothetical protein
MTASRFQSAPSGRSPVHSETGSQHAISFGYRASRLIGAQTACATNNLASTGPSRGARNSSRPRATYDARDPGGGLCAHPHLGQIRHDGSPSRQGLWRSRRRDRAHSPPSLTADSHASRGHSPIKEKRHGAVIQLVSHSRNCFLGLGPVVSNARRWTGWGTRIRTWTGGAVTGA